MSIDSIQIGSSDILKAFLGNTLIYQKTVVGYNPLSLFTGGKKGVWLEPSDKSTLFQDASGTVAVTTEGDPVGKVTDKSGNNTAVTQSVSAARMVYSATPSRLTLDKVDDALVITVPTGGYVGSMTIATTTGTATYGINIPAGNFTLGGRYFPTNNIVGAVIRAGAMTAEDQVIIDDYFVGKGAVKSFVGVTSMYMYWMRWGHLTSFPLIDTSAVTTMQEAWRECKSLTSFPLIDTSSVSSFYFTWFDCISLTSFPLIDTSSVSSFYFTWGRCSSLTGFPLLDTSSATTFYSAWYGCTKLADFPPNMFDTVKTGIFTDAFLNTALTQVSIDNILTSLVTSGVAAGTRVFKQSGGSAPSITGTSAIDTLRARGWTVTVTGGY